MRHASRCAIARVVLMSMAFVLGGCFEEKGGGNDGGVAADPPASPLDPGGTFVNHPPQITGVPAASATAGEPYSFVPEASDEDDDFLEFTITNKPEWAQFSEETGELAGTPGDEHVGDTDDITITVTDGRATRSIGPFRIRVRARAEQPNPTNAPPAFDESAVPPEFVDVGTLYDFQPVASDPDGDRLLFAVSNRPSWASFDPSSGRLSGTPGTSHVGTYDDIVISVSDGTASTQLPAFAIQVRGPDNSAPSISGTPSTSAQVGQFYSFAPSASDPDGDRLIYRITNRPGWASFDRSTGRLTGAPTADDVGDYVNIVISVSDGRASASLPPFSISVQGSANRAPTIGGTPRTRVSVGSFYSFRPEASDADQDDLGFSIRNRPRWASFDTATGRLSGTPTNADVGTYRDIVITVSDGRASTSLPAFSIRVSGSQTSANNPPQISGTPPSSANIGALYSFLPSASDPDGDELEFSIENRPSWATFDENTGRLRGTPGSEHGGTYSNIVITVSDGIASVSLPAFSITVNQAATGSATLSWQPPTQNEDGTPLTNLAGFRVAYGRAANQLTQEVDLPNPGLTSYVVTGLSSGTWYFAVKAYTSTGAESDLSRVGSKTIP